MGIREKIMKRLQVEEKGEKSMRHGHPGSLAFHRRIVDAKVPTMERRSITKRLKLRRTSLSERKAKAFKPIRIQFNPEDLQKPGKIGQVNQEWYDTPFLRPGSSPILSRVCPDEFRLMLQGENPEWMVQTCADFETMARLRVERPELFEFLRANKNNLTQLLFVCFGEGSLVEGAEEIWTAAKVGYERRDYSQLILEVMDFAMKSKVTEEQEPTTIPSRSDRLEEDVGGDQEDGEEGEQEQLSAHPAYEEEEEDNCVKLSEAKAEEIFSQRHKLFGNEQTERGEWSTMHIVDPFESDIPGINRLYSRVKLSRRSVVKDYGTTIRRPEKLFTDFRAFARKSKDRGGTFLFDVSGSMGGLETMFDLILKHFEEANMAMYSAKQNDGHLTIFSKNGIGISPQSLNYYMGHRNQVDGPALEWLATMPKPRIWISDGMVTAHRESEPKPEVLQKLRDLIAVNGIRRVESHDFVDMLRGRPTKFVERGAEINTWWDRHRY